MPFYYRRRRYNYWNRKPWTRRNRFRRRIRRRFSRRWVRQFKKTKLKTIHLKEWQPPTIRKCTIKGKTCLLYFSPQRLSFNGILYEDSITPDHWPGGGGFSVYKFSLESLYESHLRCRNWWTQSNDNLPLCRYTGCSFRFYQCEQTDYVVKIQTVLPATSNPLTYPSCQPSMMLMSSHKHVIPSRQTKKKRKPYYTVRLPPPSQFTNKWYFQKDLNDTPLAVVYTAACSLQNYFVKPNELSNNCTFTILNTETIQNRNYKDNEQSWPYKIVGGTVGYYMYFLHSDSAPENGDTIKVKDLCALANPRNDTPGYAFSDNSNPEPQTNWLTYWQGYKKYWGNPLNHHILEEDYMIYISTMSPESLARQVEQKAPTNQNATWKEIQPEHPQTLTKLGTSLTFKLQYNPNRDTGQDNYFYLLSNQEGHGWDEPIDEKLVLKGFPIWLGLYGLIDWHQKLKNITNIETKGVVVFKTKTTYRPFHFPIVVLNQRFTEGKSPYENTVLDADKTLWYPMTQHQVEEINKIVKTGPGTPYINQLSENIQMFYKFHFKWGGAPAKTINIENPSHQIQYPIPRNEHETPSLQNPAQAPETVLYSFDYRHGNITGPALKRISDDWSTKKFFDSITEPEKRIQLQKAFQNLQESEQEEQAQETKIQHQLIQLRQQQQLLREHIMSLLMQLE